MRKIILNLNFYVKVNLFLVFPFFAKKRLTKREEGLQRVECQSGRSGILPYKKMSHFWLPLWYRKSCFSKKPAN